MPPNPDILQIRLGAQVTLVLVRDRVAQEYKLVLQERGIVSRRTEVAIPEGIQERIVKFLQVPVYAPRHVITDDAIPEAIIEDDGDITAPEIVRPPRF